MSKKKFVSFAILLILFFGGPLYVLLSNQLALNQHWRKADRTSAGIAPNCPRDKAVVNIYAARSYGYRGMFAIHTWVTTKPKNSTTFTVYQCVGWNLLRGRPTVEIKQGIPDRKWYGNKPWILLDLRGKPAEQAIKQIKIAVHNYPFKNKYLMWPGPNSNSFTAYIIRNSPALNTSLPVTAIGKDYFPTGTCTIALSKTGKQCSLKGLLSLTLAKKEGLELGVLGLGFAINLDPPYLHIPGIG